MLVAHRLHLESLVRVGHLRGAAESRDLHAINEQTSRDEVDNDGKARRAG